MTNCVPNLDSWLPMPEVIAATRMSQRTIYRMVSEGKLRQASRPIPGRRPLPVFDPADVAELAQLTLKARPEVISPMAESRQDGAQALPPMEFWAALIDAVKARPAELSAAAETAETIAPTLAELRNQIIVTRRDAARLGFTGRILADAIRRQTVTRLPGGRYRVRELEAL